MGNLFVPVVVLLSCECKSDGGGSLDLMERCRPVVDRPGSQMEGDVLQEERLIISGSPGAFTGAQQEMEGQATALASSVRVTLWAIRKMQRMSVIGTGFTRLGGGSALA